jgi:glycosyltransferase involved in cell wall biosynthesis
MANVVSHSPLFTAAIICFNRPALVRAAIESALAQSFKDFELVIVDDASTDNSSDVIRTYSDRANIIIREENGGEMAARNTALAAAHGQYMAFLDSDDMWFPWTLATFAEAIRRHGKLTMVAGKAFNFTDEAALTDVKREEYAESTASCYFKGRYQLGSNAVAICRQAIEDVGGFTPLRLNSLDMDLMFRIADRPGFVQIDSPVTFAYRQHSSIIRNVELSYGGAMHIIQTELAGKYPGGSQLWPDRMWHVTRRTRSVSLQFIRQGQFRKALEIYLRTFWWNLRKGHGAYLVGLPAMMLCPPLARRFDRRMKQRHGY